MELCMKETKSIGKRFVVSIALLGLLVTSAHGEDTIAIRHLQLNLHSENTMSLRLVSDRPIDYRAFVLSNPYRLVFDGINVEWALPQSSPATGIGFIARYRFGKFSDHLGRLVLDSQQPVIIRSIAQYFGNDDKVVVTLNLGLSDEADFAQHRLKGAFVSRDGLTFEKTPPLAVKKEPQKPVQRQKPLIVIDAGHGGVDSGAIGVSGLQEKEINLDMSLRLARLINTSGRATAVLTRHDDRFIPLTHRHRFASHKQADLFVSIHADSIHKPAIKGLSIYGLSDKASDEVASHLAQRENKSDVIGGMDLSRNSDDVQYILIDLVQKQSMKRADVIAQNIIKNLKGKVDLLQPPHRFAGFVVLKAPDVPSLLIEMGYLSNPQEELKLRDTDYREFLAQHLVAAILQSVTQ